MFGLLGIAAIISTCVEGIKNAFTPTLTSDDWANKDLIHRDIMNGNSANLSKNAHRGRYRLAMKYREPHLIMIIKKQKQHYTGKRHMMLTVC